MEGERFSGERLYRLIVPPGASSASIAIGLVAAIDSINIAKGYSSEDCGAAVSTISADGMQGHNR